MRSFVGIALIIAAVAIAGVTLTNALVYDASDDPEIEVPQTAVIEDLGPATPQEYPDRIRIPAIALAAKVEHVGIAKSGRMAVPRAYANAGWFKHGTVPGRVGSAVIAGHVDNGFGLAAAFKKLKELEPGDEIFIRRADGTELRFAVESVKSYPLQNVPKDIFTKNGSARLTLITCDGELIKTTNQGLTYDRRLIVSGTLAPS